MKDVRCGKCSRKLAMANFIELQIKCPRCGTLNHLKAESLPVAPTSATDRRQYAASTDNSMDRRQA